MKLPYFAEGMSKYFNHSIYRFGTAKLVNKRGKYYLHIPVTYEVEESNISDICNVVGSYNSNFFFVYSILCVVAIFIICIIIDKIRIYCFEKPFFKFWDNYVAEKLNAIKKKIIK